MLNKTKQLLRPLKIYIFRKLGIKELYKYGYMHPTANLSDGVIIYEPQNLYMYENTTIHAPARIMNPRSKFILKKGSGAAVGLLVIPGNHLRLTNMSIENVTDEVKDKVLSDKSYDKDVIVDEEVWMGANVTLLNGVHIGRGCSIGAGSVVRGNIPPYAVVVGNPCKVVGFVFTPEEIIEHEELIYPEEDRIPIETLQKNYKKYFIDRRKEIRNFMKL